MSKYENLCPNCFSKVKDADSFCMKCGWDLSKDGQTENSLPSFTLLNEQYLIGRILGQGGFGITYKAYDTFKNQPVAIKEYMPVDFAQRDDNYDVVPREGERAKKIFHHGKSSYIDEIKTLYQFDNAPNIVHIIGHFQDHNTAYLVMEYLDGCNLKQYVKSKGGKIDVAEARNFIYAIASTLINVHAKNVLHRDISPENIYLVNSNRDAKLIDFGAARSYVENEEQDKSVLLKPGFAPPEQYSRSGNQGPWTDVYALAATL